MISENVFGIWVNRWQIFHSAVVAYPEHVVISAKACVVLHNFLRFKDDYCMKEFADHYDQDGHLILGGWRSLNNETVLWDLDPYGGSNWPTSAKKVRDDSTRHFYNEGAVPWQMDRVNDDGRVPRLDSLSPYLSLFLVKKHWI